MVRKTGKKSTQTLWIFCEGKTEKIYFNKLKIDKRISRISIRPFECGHSNADGIVQEAIDFTQKNDYWNKDMIVCVFDRDANTKSQLDVAKRKARDNGIKLIFSNPSFEFWIISHFGYYPTSTETDTLISQIEQKLGSYNKTDRELYIKLKDKTPDALKNSKKIFEMHIKNEKELISRETNPITFVHELVTQIDKYAK